MKKADVIIDRWKLPIFTRHLRDAGYRYDTVTSLTDNTYTMIVEFESVAKLQPIIEAAQLECAATKKGGAA